MSRRESTPGAASNVRDWELKPARDLGVPLRQRLRSARRESGLIGATAHLAWITVLRGYLRAAHRLRVVGREHIPTTPPFVMIANHASHLDALCLASLLPVRFQDRVFPIAAGDTFFETPGATAFAALCLNALPMWRERCGRHALDDLRIRLTEDRLVYILFPEGTRSRSGVMGPFKAGVGMLLAGASVPIVPCGIDGAFAAWPPDRRRPRWSTITVRIGPPLAFPEAANRRSGWDEISTRCETAVRGLIEGEF